MQRIDIARMYIIIESSTKLYEMVSRIGVMPSMT